VLRTPLRSPHIRPHRMIHMLHMYAAGPDTMIHIFDMHPPPASLPSRFMDSAIHNSHTPHRGMLRIYRGRGQRFTIHRSDLVDALPASPLRHRRPSLRSLCLCGKQSVPFVSFVHGVYPDFESGSKGLR
jgi:hypothetical protein